MNTHLSVKPESSSKPVLLTAQQKSAQEQQNSQTKTGKSAANAGLRYPKDLERCFVLGNN
ncbi:hypothetical protein ACONUD_17830 [Microbulbifer harenosus]|uniref:Uncharacterized protein n=1 Tax=Microbulbifer harenosus TaxID=2576840 RepID=A0ABY2UJ77_9GAMM|nr:MULTISPECIES: hypothetical protein [Microbulbifer]QIL90359.1 hypothetical protein GNX18_11795 [Microbulbifer sp. SH-1]TLM78199.1 hypothetical protein FDY93_07170 [Microbulbifer harenosus]